MINVDFSIQYAIFKYKLAKVVDKPDVPWRSYYYYLMFVWVYMLLYNNSFITMSFFCAELMLTIDLGGKDGKLAVVVDIDTHCRFDRTSCKLQMTFTDSVHMLDVLDFLSSAGKHDKP